MKKALIIVDVQTSYGEYYSYSYLKKLYSFMRNNAKNYEKVYSLYQPLVDRNLNFSTDSMVSFVSENSIPVCKVYDDDYSFSLINKDEVNDNSRSSIFINPEKLAKAVELFNSLNTNTIQVSNGELLMRKLEGSVLPGREYRIEFISKQMLDMIKELQENGYEVDLVGGGRTKCVEITDGILHAKGINTTVLNDLCYEIRFVNSNRHTNIFKKNPSKSMFRKDLLNIDGSLRVTEMPVEI